MSVALITLESLMSATQILAAFSARCFTKVRQLISKDVIEREVRCTSSCSWED